MSEWQRRLEGISRCPPKTAWLTRSRCLIFVSNLASTAKKERYFVEEVTRVTWAKQQEEKSGIPQNIRNAFSACPTF